MHLTRLSKSIKWNSKWSKLTSMNSKVKYKNLWSKSKIPSLLEKWIMWIWPHDLRSVSKMKFLCRPQFLKLRKSLRLWVLLFAVHQNTVVKIQIWIWKNYEKSLKNLRPNYLKKSRRFTLSYLPRQTFPTSQILRCSWTTNCLRSTWRCSTSPSKKM